MHKLIMGAMMSYRSFFVAVALMLAQGPVEAQQPPSNAELSAIAKSLTPQKGMVALSDAKATLNLGDAYYFLPADQAKRVLTEGWGNPPEAVANVIGMVFPKGKTFADDTWGAVVTFEASGYVTDTDANSTDYGELLTTMRNGEAEHNEELQKAGFPTQTLVGWAQQPTYDVARHSLIWARQIKFAGSREDTLNYDVRMLGRNGVLSLNMVTTMSDLSNVRTAAAGLANTASFDAGSRYADFDPATDKSAGYGLAGLVAAGAGAAAAKKLGLLAIILGFGKKFIVLIIAAFAGLAGVFRRIFGKSTDDA